MAINIPQDIVALTAQLKESMSAAIFWSALYMIEAKDSDNDAQIDASRSQCTELYREARSLATAYFERVNSFTQEVKHLDDLAHIAKLIHDGDNFHRESIYRRFDPHYELDEWRKADLEDYENGNTVR